MTARFSNMKMQPDNIGLSRAAASRVLQLFQRFHPKALTRLAGIREANAYNTVTPRDSCALTERLLLEAIRVESRQIHQWQWPTQTRGVCQNRLAFHYKVYRPLLCGFLSKALMSASGSAGLTPSPYQDQLQPSNKEGVCEEPIQD